MFLNAINDPFMGEKVIDYDVFKKSKNAILATNEYAGHMGYHETVFNLEQWFVNPCMDFLDGLRKR
jgi:predicted alpha/beta-fold hydrolase